MTDILDMTPEQYDDAQTACGLHRLQDFIDGARIATHGMSVYGFKNGNNIQKSRQKELEKMHHKINSTLGIYQSQDDARVQSDRAKLKGGFAI